MAQENRAISTLLSLYPEFMELNLTDSNFLILN